MAAASLAAQDDPAADPSDDDELLLGIVHGDWSALALTSAQQACQVAPELTLIAALAVPDRRPPPYTVSEENLFARLQHRYQVLRREHTRTAALASPPLFKLSPLLLAPSPTTVAAASTPDARTPAAADGGKAAIPPNGASGKARERAEAQARRAEEELLELLAREERCAQMSTERQRAQQQPRRRADRSAHGQQRDRGGSGRNGAGAAASPRPGLGASDGRAASTDTTTIEELTAARGTPLDEASYHPREWTEVGRKARRAAPAAVDERSRRRRASQWEAQEAAAAGGGAAAGGKGGVACGGVPGERETGEGTASAIALDNVVSAPQSRRRLRDGPRTQQPAASSEGDDAEEIAITAGSAEEIAITAGSAGEIATTAGSAGEIAKLRREVAELRVALSAKEEAMAKERAAHQAALAIAQEREGTRLQALQLRLHVATTGAEEVREELAAVAVRHASREAAHSKVVDELASLVVSARDHQLALESALHSVAGAVMGSAEERAVQWQASVR